MKSMLILLVLLSVTAVLVPEQAGAETAAALDPAYTDGVRLRDKGHLEEAVVKFNEALSRHNKSTEILYARGITFGWQGEQIKAIADFENAVSLDSGNDEYSRCAKLSLGNIKTIQAEKLLIAAATMRIANDLVGANAKYHAALNSVYPEDRAEMQEYYSRVFEVLIDHPEPGPAPDSFKGDFFELHPGEQNSKDPPTTDFVPPSEKRLIVPR